MKQSSKGQDIDAVKLHEEITDHDVSLFDDVFYFRHDELFQKIHREEKAIQAAVDKLAGDDKDAATHAEIEFLQKRINRIKKIQLKLNDRHLEDFKELIYPAAKFVPALALFGLGGLAIVLGPTFAMLFAAGFLTSNMMVKGKRSMLSVHFGIATTIQVSAVVLGSLVLAGVASVNPAVVTGLVVLGGTWLFTTAVFRGGLRQMKARDIKLANIEKNMDRLYAALDGMHKKVSWLTSEPEMRTRLIEYFDTLIQSQLWQDHVILAPKDLYHKFGIRSDVAEDLLNQIAKVKVFHDEFTYDLQDYENLLRTVKNPFEKLGRIRDIRKIEAKAVGKSCGFELVKKDAVIKVKETGDDIEYVFKKDVPWFASNIALLGIAATCMPLVGMLIFGAPIIASPPVLIAVGALAVGVGIAYLYFHLKERQINKAREERDDIKRCLHESLNEAYVPDNTEKSQALSKQTGTPMFIDKEEITIENGAKPKPKTVADDAHRHEPTTKRKKDSK